MGDQCLGRVGGGGGGGGGGGDYGIIICMVPWRLALPLTLAVAAAGLFCGRKLNYKITAKNRARNQLSVLLY